MGTLTNERRTAWHRDSPRAAEAEIQELKPQIPEWALGRSGDYKNGRLDGWLDSAYEGTGQIRVIL
jgi:hypothetical protein